MDLIEILNPKDSAGAERLQSLRDASVSIVDTYEDQLQELGEINDPARSNTAPVNNCEERYVYYPWRNTLVRIVDEPSYITLRTNRNKQLLTDAEQKTFASARIGFAGLNVGNPGAVCIALEGGSHAMKLADFDPLSLTNLNRFRAGLPDLGVNKATLTARQILEIDPYYSLELYENGLTPHTVATFMEEPQIDLLVEEMDALPLKIRVREAAKQLKIPVLMVTGNGEGILLDVERYDTEIDLPLLNGLLDTGVAEASLSPDVMKLSKRERAHLARDFMGKKYLDKRLLESFEAFGQTLAGIPQLAESSFLRGAALCYAAKAIILGREMPSGRYTFSFNEHMKRIT